jgi:hypothetical protein
MIFPIICPQCHAHSGRVVIPESPEVDTFCCGHCQHQWSEPARAISFALRSEAINEQRWRDAIASAAPRD